MTKVRSLSSSIQQTIKDTGETPHLVYENVAKIDFPFTGTISETPINSSLSFKDQKIEELKALFANKNGLQITKISMKGALKSTSTTGTEGKQFYHLNNR